MKLTAMFVCNVRYKTGRGNQSEQFQSSRSILHYRTVANNTAAIQ